MRSLQKIRRLIWTRIEVNLILKINKTETSGDWIQSFKTTLSLFVVVLINMGSPDDNFLRAVTTGQNILHAFIISRSNAHPAFI